ncbi:MAG TPA: twin-arginine translocase subunit TatB [Thiotrichaceae bacterium]|jgi:sec-independent protein translocase protein TatB|nr:twin-arginine translocase subunit TatB [Thiotrichaceae bacterium]HIM07608.1 twin-arginine translocase subunit TatB [Gammaproteobacteria bacterium]
MFDIGFWELVIMALVALVIIGPERLPDFARDAGRWIRKIRLFIQSAKREVEKELKLDELNDLNESIDHVDGLLKQAPDRILKDQMIGKNESDSTK